MSSSTSSSERGWPVALVAAIALIACIEAIVAATAPAFMEAQPLIYETKLGAVGDALHGDVVVLGDSTAVAAVRPADLDAAFGADVRVVNLAMPGSGPVVGEWLLDRILEARPDAPPRLLVLGFAPLTFTEWRPNFVEYPLTHVLPFVPAVRAAWAERDFGYVLEWVATRLPSLRNREELKSGARSLVFDRWPALASRYRALTGSEEDDIRFAWRHFDRAGRNRRLADALIAERGWRIFEEMRLAAGELHPDVRFDRGVFHFPPFRATPREEQALARLLDRAAAHRIPVLVLPAAVPRALADATLSEGGGERLAAYAQRMLTSRPDVSAPLGLELSWPHRYFGDLAHVNEAGLARYTDTILPILRATELAPNPPSRSTR